MVYAPFFCCRMRKAPWHVVLERRCKNKDGFQTPAPTWWGGVFENRLNENRKMFYFLRMMVASRSGPTETIVIGVPVAFSIYSM